MKKNVVYLAIVCIAFLITSCICGDDPSSSTRLNTVSLDLINLSYNSNLTYEDELGERSDAIVTFSESEIGRDQPGPESCEFDEFEIKKSSIFIRERNGVTIDLLVESPGIGTSGLSARLLTGDGAGGSINAFLTNLNTRNGIEAQDLTTISIQGFNFENAIELSGAFGSDRLYKVIVTLNNGVEFIEYPDGTYLKLIV